MALPRLSPRPKTTLLFLSVSTAFSFVLLLPYLHGHWHLADDAFYQALPSFVLQLRILKEGMWSLWNPNVGLGQPWALTPQETPYYPPQLIWGFLIGWSETKYLYFTLLHWILGGWAAAEFSKRIGLTTAACLFFMLAYLGNGLAIGFISNTCLYIPYLAWPLLGLGLIDLYQTRPKEVKQRKRAVRTVILALVMIETGGYPLSKILILLCTALTYYFMTTKPGQRLQIPRWKTLTAASFISFLICSPEIITTLESLKLSERIGTSIYDDSIYHNVSNFLQLGTLILPAQFLARNQFQLGSMHLERSWWIGSLTLAMLFTGFYAQLISFQKYRVPILISFFCLLYALGGHSFFRELASISLPIFEHLRHSHLARMYLNGLLCLAAATVFSALESRKSRTPTPSQKQKTRRTLGTLWIGFIILCTVAALSEADHPLLAKELYIDAATGWKLGALHTIFYPLLAYTVYASRFVLFEKYTWPVVLVAIQFFSLADAGYSFRYLLAERRETPIKEVAENFKVATPQPNLRVNKAWFDGNDWYSWENNTKVLNAYDQPNHRAFEEAKNDPKIAPLLTTLASCQDRIHEVLSANDAAEAIAAAGNAPYSCQESSFQIDYYFGNILQFSGSSANPILLVAHDLNDPHWTASLNQKPVPVLPAFRLLKAVAVPAQRNWTVRFEYKHPLFPFLWFVSVAGFLLMIFLPAALLKETK